ncbi:hypothetical protein B6U99_01530 [Candidatus Geothermarchaeota archaeon ex4572_27]|nr:MAG: hypothetical protein B6U99_01530 [Candidatus Geothermarchaeota archaeon ex4572_27]
MTTNINDLIYLFKLALEKGDDVIIDPYDYALITKLLPPDLAVELYNKVTQLTEEEKEEVDQEIEEYEVLILHDKKLFRSIINVLEKYAKRRG